MGTAGQSITLANSIIGVGILAMPFCFQQCGVVLATVILIFMGLISRLCCYFLLKAALLARRRNFEFLAFHVFGPAGKFAVEVGIIGFLMGTCIAYFVVVGDLGPQIIAKLLNINQSDILRTSIMVIVSLVCVLPLGLLRNVDSLSNVSAATIGFYFCLVIKVITEAASQLFAGDWHTKMEMWKPSGVLQCVPIFSMALFCQTQLFEIFESLPTLSLEKMNVVTKNAINICTCVYFTLGLFGYIAFCSHPISGNILMSLSPTMANDVIKLGFVMSLAFSFPLIIFPCRASLYSFLYRKAHPAHHDHIINHSIPETTFRCITVGIIAVALFISLLIPNIELVLGLVGSTIGVLICLVFPAACFVNVTFKNTNERLLAKGILMFGVLIMVLGTYANLQAADYNKYEDTITPERIDKIVEDFFQNMDKHDVKPIVEEKPLHKEVAKVETAKNSEVQPPNPVPPDSNEKRQEVDKTKTKDEEVKIPSAEKLIPVLGNDEDKVSETHPKNLQTKLNEGKNLNGEKKITKELESPKEISKSQTNQAKNQEKIDIIKQRQLIETIKQHGEEQKELIKEQKEILDELIKTKNELQQNKKEIDSVEAKKIAVESIQKIADMAIKSLSGVSEKPEQKADNKREPLEKIANDVVQEIAKKAEEAIEEIKEQKPAASNVVNTGNAGDHNNINPNPVQNSQANAGNVPQPSVSNFAPINPPVANQNSANAKPRAESLIQNMAPGPQVNEQPIVNQIVNNDQVDSNNMKNHILVMPSPDDGQQNQIRIQPNQLAQQETNQNLQEQNQINQQKRQIDQQTSHVKPPNVQIHDPSQNQHNFNNQPVENDNKNIETKKTHSYVVEEPKRGEDTETLNGIPKNFAQNVPIPIAMNGNAKTNVNGGNQQNEVKDTQNGVNKVQNINNGVKDDTNNNVDSNAAAVRQKRETVLLQPENKEICKVLVNNKIETSNKIQKTSEEILSNVDLAEIGLNNSPVEMMIHHGRSLKSIDEIEKKR